MLITTKGSSNLLRKAFRNDKADVLGFDTICQNIVLDPTVFNPERDVYILCSDDVKNKVAVDQFMNALASKHPKSKIVFIDRNRKGSFVDTNIKGLNLYLMNPKPDELASKVSTLIEMEIQEVIDKAYEEEEVKIPEYKHEFKVEESSEEEEQITFAEIPDESNEAESDLVLSDTIPDRESEYTGRMSRVTNIVDVANIARELEMQTMIKDIIDSNSTYAGIEEKIKSIKYSVFDIMSDSSYKTISEKAEKVRALFRDKAYFAVKGGTLIEQYVEDLVDIICERVSSIAKKTEAEINKKIIEIEKANYNGDDVVRLAGLNDERNNLMKELLIFKTGLAEGYKATDDMVHNGILAITNHFIDGEEHSHIREVIRANGDIAAPSEILDAIMKTSELKEKVYDTFTSSEEIISRLISTIQKVLDLDRETIMAQASIIKMMKARTVEDTIINKSILKSALKVYTGFEGSGRTIIPYILAEFKSRQRANVLYIDCTGENKLSNYGIEYMDLNSYINNLPEQQFCVVSGNLNDSPENAQTMLTALYKASDYYKVIMLVLRPDQKTMFDTLSTDILSMNYVTDTEPTMIEKLKPIIEETDYDNVGKRVIFNKCEIGITKMLQMLNLNDRMDVSAVKIPVISDITNCSFDRINPCLIKNVQFYLEEVLKKC